MAVPEKTPIQLLASPVQFLKGVGPQRGELLERLGLRTARDLIFCFPRPLKSALGSPIISQNTAMHYGCPP